MVFPSQTTRFLQYTLQSSLSYSSKVNLILTILVHTATSRISGFCWLIDEILYRQQLNALSITEPLFVLSAYRSASTQMARTLARDTKRFVVPNAIMCAFPYLWLWKLVIWLFGDSDISTEEANRYLNKNFTQEALERHDNNHFEIDTFDGYFLSSHLNGLAFQLGSGVIEKEFNCARFEEWNRSLFEESFVEHVDRIARKTLLYNRVDAASDQRFMLKGHFLQSADALRKRYPDGCFLSVLRDPMDRLQSGINHMAVNATLWQGKAPDWNSLAEAFQKIEVEYCEVEMDWYSADDTKRLAVKFDDFVKHSQKTMTRVYRGLLDCNIDDIPRVDMTAKGPKLYAVNKSLKELGVDEAALKQQVARYYAWMKKQ